MKPCYKSKGKCQRCNCKCPFDDRCKNIIDAKNTDLVFEWYKLDYSCNKNPTLVTDVSKYFQNLEF